MSKEHEHNFVAEKRQYQELANKYLGDSKYQSATLVHEEIIIFCTKCGESKNISPKPVDNKGEKS